MRRAWLRGLTLGDTGLWRQRILKSCGRNHREIDYPVVPSELTIPVLYENNFRNADITKW